MASWGWIIGIGLGMGTLVGLAILLRGIMAMAIEDDFNHRERR